MKTIKQLFTKYEEAFCSLNIDHQAELFADSFVSAGPNGSIAQGKKEFLETAEQASAFYKSMGFNSARIISLEKHPISENYVLVKIHWRVIFTNHGERVVEFDVSYVVQIGSIEPKVVMFITHQDENQFMQQLRSEK